MEFKHVKEFLDRVEIVRDQFIGERVCISGGPTRTAYGLIAEIIPTPDHDSVQVVLKSGAKYGMALDEVRSDEFSGTTSTLSQFIRTVKVSP